MKLADIFTRETIVPELKAATKKDAIEEMVSTLVKAKLVSQAQSGDLLAALVRREEIGSTGIGRGVGVPHVKHPCASRIIGVFARSSKGIEFNALDGGPVYIVFMLVSPPDCVEPHLKTLKKVSALTSDNDFRRFLINAKDCSELVELMKEADERL